MFDHYTLQDWDELEAYRFSVARAALIERKLFRMHRDAKSREEAIRCGRKLRNLLIEINKIDVRLDELDRQFRLAL